MTRAQTEEPIPRKPLRLWPGVVIVVLQWLLGFVVPVAFPDAGLFGVLGALGLGLAIVVWWAFFSRAPGLERWAAILLMVGGLAAVRPLLHESVATAGMGIIFFIYAIPVLSLAFVVWAVATRGLADGPRRATMVATILLACGLFALVRVEGIYAGVGTEPAWRWSKTHEERLVARSAVESMAMPRGAPASEGAAWPGFRGPRRDGHVRGVRIDTDWTASPPVEQWRRPVGPGWSSFAVGGDLFYTQEQRADEEVVSGYSLATGEPVWRHGDAARFWEANAGPGPRATPTLSGGRVYSLGATGNLNVLDAGTGALLWARDAAADAGEEIPTWGFAGSPLVVDDIVVVALAGTLVAYGLDGGEPRWLGPDGGAGYSSPHLVTLDGVPQILLLDAAGVTSVVPADGAVLWEHAWKGYPIVQPALTEEGDVLVSVTSSSGTRRLSVRRGPGGWSAEERWTSQGLKPYFNDLVVHRGHAYGFDGGILSCIDLEAGERKWKGGRYGHGQLVLLPDQDLLLVLSERGQLALVAATPERFTELSRAPAVEGKTWNHPVLVGDLLLVRNGREMAAFRLASASG